MIIRTAGITIKLDNTPEMFADLINQMAVFMESNAPPPDHWEEDKREMAYARIKQCLNMPSVAFLKKIQDK